MPKYITKSQQKMDNKITKNPKIPTYQKTPEWIMYFINHFHKHNISYILFKCDHIFGGMNKNLDILFETDIDYKKAAYILEQHNFVIQLSEKVEKFKTMYVGLYKNNPSHPLSIHLHREVAWHGMKALDKEPLFQRKQTITQLIIIPSIEDSILIHTAHALFENFKITEKEKIYLNQIDDININREYIRNQLEKNNWRKGFNKVINRMKRKEKLIPKITILSCWFKKLIREPLTAIYLFKKITTKIVRPLSNKKRGYLIALIGVNGSGKSTLARKLLLAYEPLTTHIKMPQEQIYFGWKPEFFLTKILSKVNKKTNTISFNEMNITKKKKENKFNLKKEILFVYIFLEYIYRYYTTLHPKLKKKYVIITDRYFYDIYGQYPYAKKSIILPTLIKLFPNPNKTYILEVEVRELQQRKKTDKNTQHIIEKEREIYPAHYLEQQRENYLYLSKIIKSTILDARNNTNEKEKIVIEQTWKEIIQET